MKRALLIALAIACGPALGQTSCLPSVTALQSLDRVNPADGVKQTYVLQTPGPQGAPVDTRARLSVVSVEEDQQQLELKVHFAEFDGVGLAFNLFAVQVLVGGEVVYFMDYTRSCRGAGVSVYPGGEFRLPRVKLVGVGAQRLQIMVWGKL